MKEMSRRSFLKAGTAATAALALTPSELLAKAKASKKNAPTGKIKLAWNPTYTMYTGIDEQNGEAH